MKSFISLSYGQACRKFWILKCKILIQKIYSKYFDHSLKWTTWISQEENLIKCKISFELYALILNHSLENWLEK